MYKRNNLWESRGVYVYKTEFLTDSLILLAHLLHYCQILYIHGLSFTLIDAVLFLNMRIAFDSLREKINSYRNYQRLVQVMNSTFPSVGPEEFKANNLDDTCIICRDKMEHARKLPCSHLFHENCIRGWIENHQNCPTCRTSLIVDTVGINNRNNHSRNYLGRRDDFSLYAHATVSPQMVRSPLLID